MASSGFNSNQSGIGGQRAMQIKRAGDQKAPPQQLKGIKTETQKVLDSLQQENVEIPQNIKDALQSDDAQKVRLAHNWATGQKDQLRQAKVSQRQAEKKSVKKRAESVDSEELVKTNQESLSLVKQVSSRKLNTNFEAMEHSASLTQRHEAIFAGTSELRKQLEKGERTKSKPPAMAPKEEGASFTDDQQVGFFVDELVFVKTAPGTAPWDEAVA